MDQIPQKSVKELEIAYEQAVAYARELKKEIAEQGRIEQALRESQEKYQTLIEQSGDAIFLLYGGRFEVVNTRFQELFGVTQENANAPDFIFTNIVAPKSKNVIGLLPEKSDDPKLRPHYEFTARDKAGQEIEVELTVSYPTYKRGLATLGVIRDITDRKRAEEEKRKAYEQIQQYSNELAARIKEVQRQREIASILAEVVASVSLTLSTDEVLHNILLKLHYLVPYDSAAILLSEDNYLVIKAARGFEVEIINHKFSVDQNGLVQAMHAQKSYILIPDTRFDKRYQFWFGAENIRTWIGAPLLVAQEVIGYLTVDRYIPNTFSTNDAGLVQAFAHQVAQTIYNAQLFADLHEAQAQLIERERLAALGQMAATVAHDLRNPLMAIRMGVEYFVHDLPQDDPHRQGAALMQTNITRIDWIVDNILYVARAHQPNLIPGSLRTVLKDEIAHWKLNLNKKRITYHLDLAEDLPPIPLDTDQMERALSNLISNSLDAMGSDGELHVTLRGEDGWQIMILADNGPGISAEYQAKIFEPFFTTKLQGTGLGLSIVKQIIDTHNGDINVWSEAGVGTKFIITLPQAENHNTEEE